MLCRCICSNVSMRFQVIASQLTGWLSEMPRLSKSFCFNSPQRRNFLFISVVIWLELVKRKLQYVSCSCDHQGWSLEWLLLSHWQLSLSRKKHYSGYFCSHICLLVSQDAFSLNLLLSNNIKFGITMVKTHQLQDKRVPKLFFGISGFFQP